VESGKVDFHHAQGRAPGVAAFADSSLPSYDAEAAALPLRRTLTFLRSR
jgi:hypothetical protein